MTERAPVVPETEADRLRTLEQTRLRALVEANMDVCRQLHAPDFQLITPHGRALSREQYLGLVAAGELRYLLWQPGTMTVRVRGGIALLRYEASLEVAVEGNRLPAFRCWHTDTYEKRDGCWQVVWSQATEIR